VHNINEPLIYFAVRLIQQQRKKLISTSC